MFDWNDEELANIIWGEAAESDDHIVPYSKGSHGRPLVVSGDEDKKGWIQELSAIKPEQKTLADTTNLHGSQLESISHFDTNEELSASALGMESWPDLSKSNAAKTDQDSLGTEVSNNLTEIARYDSSTDHENFQNRHEDKEQSDLIDYGWANIGSFDDLDIIFSNDGPTFGHPSLGNTDELLSSSKDDSTVKSIPLSADSPSLGLGVSRNASEQFNIKTEFTQDEDHSFTPGHERMSDPRSPGLHNVYSFTAGDKCKPTVKEQTTWDMVGQTTSLNSPIVAKNVATLNKFADKVNKQKKVMKYPKSDEKAEGNLLLDFYGTWPPPGSQFQQFENQGALSQQNKLQGSEPLSYQHFSNPNVEAYGNLTNPYSAIPPLPCIHSGEDNQQMLSGHEISLAKANHLNKSLDGTMKSLTMTPQEKIEKLRRRQQMQAMLAIQKQQQQFSHEVFSANQSITKKPPGEKEIQHIEGADIEMEENLSSFPSLDPNLSKEQDDSETISMAFDDYSAEDAILYQLQDIISNLDIRIRLCIRDSLFRLAQSATQRHYASDTSSINQSSRDEHETVTKHDINSHDRFVKMPDMETETNPIDRTVAHLLFHRPLDSKTAGLVNSSPENASNNEASGSGILDLDA